MSRLRHLMAALGAWTSLGAAQDIRLPIPVSAHEKSVKLAPALQKFLSDLPEFLSGRKKSRLVAFAEGRIQIEAWLHPGSQWDASLYELEHGVETIYVSRGQPMVWASVPTSELERFAQRSEVAFVTTPALPYPTQTQGVELTGARVNYHSRGLLGKGVKVAVIDIGFDRLEEARRKQAIPEQAQVKNFSSTELSLHRGKPNSHGTLVAEIVHRMAPEATLYLYKIDTAADLAKAVEDCIKEKVHVINQSLGWFNTSFYDGRGAINELVERATASGSLWVNGAGNHAQRHYRGQFQDSDGDGWHEFAARDETIEIELKKGDEIQIYLTWDAWDTKDGDYDLYLWKDVSPGSSPVCWSEVLQDALSPPAESLGDCKAPEDGVYHISVARRQASRRHTLVIFSLEQDLSEYRVSEGSMPDPTSPKAFSVGAIVSDYWAWNILGEFSSRGPTNAGWVKPDLCGPSGVDTVTERGEKFHGTSAAAPHVAGAAALLREEFPGMAPHDLRLLLEANAIPRKTGTRDTLCGAGRLNLPASLSRPDIRLTSGLRLAGSVAVGRAVTAEFEISNVGSGCLHMAALTAGGRLNVDQVIDFPFHRNIVLCSGQRYRYQDSLVLRSPGAYRFFAAYQTQDGEWETSIPAGGLANHVEVTVLDGGRSLVQKMTTAETPVRGCDAPQPRATFSTNTERIYVWFLVRGVIAGDQFRVQWFAPDGSVFSAASWDPSPAGDFCFWAWIEPAKQDLAGKTGRWTVRVTLNGAPLFELYFQLISGSAGVPVFTAAGVVDPWTYRPGISPGGWTSIFGQNLASRTAGWDPRVGQLLPTNLAGVVVTFNGVPAPLSYVSPNQVTALVPGSVPEGNVAIVVQRDGIPSSPVVVSAVPAHPAIYSLPEAGGSGRFFVTAVVAGTRTLVGNKTVDPHVARGAYAGEVIDLYAIGLGRTVENFPWDRWFDGAFAVANPIRVRLANSVLEPIWAGLVSPGLYLVRLRIPQGLVPGQTPITLEVAGRLSRTDVYITIERSSGPGIRPLPSWGLVAAGGFHSFYLHPSGTLWAWGGNDEHQLGLEQRRGVDRWAPERVTAVSDLAAVAGGWLHSVALKADGTVWTWGDNTHGQLGDGRTYLTLPPVGTPSRVQGLTEIVAVAAGDANSLAVGSDGFVYGWGSVLYGSWGDGSRAPVRIEGLTGITAVASGGGHALALRQDGTVWSWGSNGWGQLGDGTTVSRRAPRPVPGLTEVVSIATAACLNDWSGAYSLALKRDGSVWAWGSNANGELGDGTTRNRLTPLRVPGLSGVVAIAAGGLHNLALRADGTVWAWGDNSYGQVGDWARGWSPTYSSPIQVAGLTDVVAIAAGCYHSLAVDKAGTVWSWGRNEEGQLGSDEVEAGYPGYRSMSRKPVRVSRKW